MIKICLIIVLIILIICSIKKNTEYYIENPNDYYLSLTTIPSRLNNIIPTLKSFIDQKIKPLKIFLCIPHVSKRTGEKYVIPDELKQFIDKHRIVKIIRCKDYGPATKLLGLLETHKINKNIIIGDDDRIMERDWTEKLIEEHYNNPFSIITGEIGQWSDDRFLAKIPWGSAGILFPANSIGNDIFYFHKKLEKECRYVDDVFWYKYFYELNGMPIVKAEGVNLKQEYNSVNALFRETGELERYGDNGKQIKCFNSNI